MAGVGELLASAVLKVVLGKLGSEIWKKLMQHVTFKEDLEAIKNMLDSLQAKLKDAERKSQTDGSVRHLLKRLKEVAYDIEDRLAAYESCYNDGNENWSDFCDKVKSRFNLPGEMKKMRQNLEEIKSEMDLTNFTIDGATDEQDWIESRVSEAELLDNKDNVGRIMEKRRIMDLLLFDEDSLFQKEEDIFFGVRTLFGDNEDKSIISIYGLGGLGKTTLAQMVFDDSATKNAFGFLAWVHVSKKFDLNAIRSSIIQQYNKRFQNGDAGSGNVDLESILTEKRCLIVLDDLWEEDDFNLEKIKIVLKKASKVIVTTRTKKVADGMNENVDLQVKLGLLPDEDCWTLFKKRALTSTTTINRHMERTGRMIVEKCQGLPLAVKSLGYILRHLPQTLDQWAAILCSDIWAEDDGPFSDKKVIPSLKLSYYNMPPYMRLCFAYCSVFPKGSHIQRSSLIQQWIALGFFEGLGSDAPERLAEHCLKQLIGMSFLQNVNVSTVF
uniref:NB-ARC domain-containing protein n=1 Tax=Oryza punctata TaxID=4537 RepID=A0A0E0LDX7_ORYPU